MSWFQSVWPLVAHAGLGSAAVVALLAAAYFSPILKREFMYAAGVVVIALTVYAVGIRDERRIWTAKVERTEGKVDKAVEDAKKSTEKDPFDDPRN